MTQNCDMWKQLDNIWVPWAKTEHAPLLFSFCLKIMCMVTDRFVQVKCLRRCTTFCSFTERKRENLCFRKNKWFVYRYVWLKINSCSSKIQLAYNNLTVKCVPVYVCCWTLFLSVNYTWWLLVISLPIQTTAVVHLENELQSGGTYPQNSSSWSLQNDNSFELLLLTVVLFSDAFTILLKGHFLSVFCWRIQHWCVMHSAFW